jgi:uncharacterized protein YkwD
MKKLFLIFSVAVCSFSFGQARITSDQIRKADSIIKSDINFTAIEAELIVLINAYRLSLNLDTLLHDPLIQATAKFQVDYCISINTLTHDNVGKMKGILERVESFTGFSPNTAGEVLANVMPMVSVANNQTIAETILSHWKMSPGHNAVLISPNMKTIGVSINRKNSLSGFFYAGAVLNSFIL